MLRITFKVPGLIQPKERPRMGYGGRFYTPKKTHDSEKIIAMYAKLAMRGQPPVAGYCILCVRFLIEPPPSWSQKKRTAALNGELFPSSSDVDNRLKNVGDAGNEIIWVDDRQIIRVIATQIYSPSSQAIVTVAEIKNRQDLEQITLEILRE